MNERLILQWLQASGAQVRCGKRQGLKRRRGSDSIGLRTPSVSRTSKAAQDSAKSLANHKTDCLHDKHDSDDMRTPSPAKRRRGNAGDAVQDEEEETPRGPSSRSDNMRRRLVLGASHSPSLSSRETTSTGNTSNRSVRNRRIEMALGSERVETCRFADADMDISSGGFNSMPAELLEMFRTLDWERNATSPYISISRKDELQQLRLPDTCFFEAAEATGAMESPPLASVAKIMRLAGVAHKRRFDEAGWNSTVHHPLLEMAIPLDHWNVGITPCTTARIHHEYLPFGAANGKMVDFCLTFEPSWPRIFQRTDASRAVDRTREALPGLSINHSNFEPLLSWPIGLSIETKRFGGSTDVAEVQLGVWQAAQWKMLQELVHKQAARYAGPSSPDGPSGVASGAAGVEASSAEPSNAAAPTLDGLVFLPAIYIVGHDWKFAATTWDRQSGEKTLWTECALGSTNSVHGIYHIIWSVRTLAVYIRETYWEWYKNNVLGI